MLTNVSEVRTASIIALMAEGIKMLAFWDIVTMMMQAVSTSEMSVCFYKNT
jgi:hypothetical protein